MSTGFEISTDDPEEFQVHMLPMVGPNRVRPARGKHFDISLKARRLNTLSLFTVKSPSLIVDQAPSCRDFGLNIPLGTAFSITDSNRRSWFKDDTYLRMPDRPFHFEAPSDCRVLVASLENDHVADYALRLSGSRWPFASALEDRIVLSTPGRFALVRGLGRLWSDLQRGDPALASAISVAEREDKVITQFVLGILGTEEADDARAEQAGTAAMVRAEDYLLAHLTCPASRAELAAVAGVSIRTLSRGFTKRWGTGPMGFLKAQRINAAHRELLGREPGETTVSEVAFRYGFTQLGKFAGEYKRAFGELPSVTLQR